MGSLIETFHIDWKLLLAQLVNFLIVLSVLYFFALKPLMKIMRDRTAKIEKGLEDAKDMEKRLAETEIGKEQAISEARREALKILDQAKAQAETEKHKMLQTAKTEVAKVVEAGKEEIKNEKERTLQSARAEMADLVIAATRKVVLAKSAQDVDREYSQKALDEVTK